MRIHPSDLAIVVIYLAVVTWFGARFRRAQTGLGGYFSGGQRAPWWVLAISIVTPETCTLALIGTPANRFAGNPAFLQIVVGYLAGRALLRVYFVPRYFRGHFFGIALSDASGRLNALASSTMIDSFWVQAAATVG